MKLDDLFMHVETKRDDYLSRLFTLLRQPSISSQDRGVKQCAELLAASVEKVGMDTRIIEWDVRDGGAWRYVAGRDGEEYAFRGCFHRVGDDVIVQTFTFEGEPDGVALETLRFEDLGDGRTRLHAQSLVDSFEGRDAWLRSGMEVGVNEGYAKLDALLTNGDV